MNSRAFREFKTGVGQANHFLITIMIGLDAVEDGAEKRESFNTTWNPENRTNSVVRSKKYAIKSALAWTVDNLDMYLRLCNREPRLYHDEESLKIAKTKHSVYNKFDCVIHNHSELAVSKFAYVDLLICWRNNSVHFDAENKLMTESVNYFQNIPSDDVVTNTYHLDVNQMLERFNSGECPTFKEAATLISMTIHFVEELDRILLRDIDQYRFLETSLFKLLKSEKDTSVFSFRNTTPEKRKKKFKQLFISAGISEDFYNEDGERFLDEVVNLREDEFINKVIEKRKEEEKKVEETEEV
ncbi:MAG: hypothetical protein E7597_02740 [Ruminococcaceae bacterium]|nr:hypothetical protein [Oscillospiraceae bacterium]